MRDLNSQSTGSKQGTGLAYALAALTAGWLVLAWPWLSGSFGIPWDAKAHFLPQLQFLAASFARGESPFWTPYVFGGHPQIADAQSLIFSPPYLGLAYFDAHPTAWAMDVTLFGVILASAMALILWFCDQGWHAGGALLAALSFAFGAAMAWRIQHVGQVLSLAYLPMVLFLIDRALRRGSLLYGAAAGAVAGFMVLGRDQVALLAVYLLIAHVAWKWWQSADRWRGFKIYLRPVSAATIAGLAVVAVPVLLTFLVAQDSNRPSIDLEGAGRGSLHPALFLTLFAPDVFGSTGFMKEYWGPPSMLWNNTGLFIAQNVGQMYFGAIPFLLVSWGVVSGVFKAREIRVPAVVLIIVALYGLGWYTPAFPLLHKFLPGVDLYRRPADAVFLFGFLASVLAGYGLHKLLSDDVARPTVMQSVILTAVPALAFAVMLDLARRFGKIEATVATLAMSGTFFIAGGAILIAVYRMRGRAPMLAAGLIAAFTVVDLHFSNGPGGATALPPSMYDVLDPATSNDTIAQLKLRTLAGKSDTRRDRIELVGFGFHWPNTSMSHELENTLGYNPVRLRLYSNATGAGDHVGLIAQKAFSPLMPSYRSQLSDLLGLRFIATSAPIEDIDKKLASGDLPLVAKTADGYIYENTHALPRVLFASSARGANFKDMISSGTWPDIDFQTTVLLEHASSALVRGPGRARIVSYHNTTVALEADSPDGGYVVLNDVWQPWWYVTVDGQEKPVLRANVLFRAVEVPPGRHAIVFSFEPLRGAFDQLKNNISQ